VSEQHNMGLDAEGEVVDLEAVIAADNADANPAMDSENSNEGDADRPDSKEVKGPEGGLAMLVEERVAQRDADEREDEEATEETEEQQVADAAAAGGEGGELVQVADIINGLDGISESFVRAGETLSGGANALGDDSDGGSIILAIGAVGLAVAGIAILASGGDDDDLPPAPPPPPPPPVNADPVAADDTAAVDEDGTVEGDVSANDTDADGDTLTYSLAEDVDGLTLNADGTFSFDASGDEFDDLADGETRDIVATINVSDGNGGTATSTLTITVTGVPDPVTTISLDVDSDGNLATLEPFSGDDGDVAFSDSADIASNAEITDFTVGDTISVDADTSNYSFTTSNDGSSADFDDLVIAFNNDGVLSQITIQDAIPAGSFVFDEDSAEDAFGADFFFEGDAAPTPPPPPPPTGGGNAGADGSVSLDDDDDASVATAFRIDAGAGAFSFEDDSDVANNIILENVSEDDLFVALNGDLDDYSFTTTGTDLIVTFNNDGVLNTVTFEDVVSVDDFVSDEASAEQALGNAFNDGVPLDFFQAG
jgi:hypothetical protein